MPKKSKKQQPGAGAGGTPATVAPEKSAYEPGGGPGGAPYPSSPW
jgi:hypothetical protein